MNPAPTLLPAPAAWALPALCAFCGFGFPASFQQMGSPILPWPIGYRVPGLLCSGGSFNLRYRILFQPMNLNILRLAALLLAPPAALHAADGTKANIVILYADDMGYGDLGAQQSRLEDPHAEPRPARRAGHAFHRRPQLLRRLHAEPLRAAYRAISLAEVSRHRELLRSARVRCRRN